MLNLSKTGGDHSGPASDRSAGGNTNVDDEDDLDEDDDNISDGEEDDIKDHGKRGEKQRQLNAPVIVRLYVCTIITIVMYDFGDYGTIWRGRFRKIYVRLTPE